MTVQQPIARLEMVDLREAWSHEARGFTPWLHENLDQLSAALGMRLEPDAMEVAVGNYSADILARNSVDDTRVLIENQLECSDHTHLGQIMTYLAGLEVRTVIWVAKAFTEPHLAAIKWLNEHTVEGFAFFAVQLRVARIANSPLAPIFDVVERPNNWERHTQAVTAQREQASELSLQRLAFWKAYVTRVPGERERSGDAGAWGHRWRVLSDLRLVITVYIAVGEVGIFIRGTRGSDAEEVRERLRPFEAALQQRLLRPIGDSPGNCFPQSVSGDYRDPAQQERLIDWLATKADQYEHALREVVSPESADQSGFGKDA